MAVRIGSNIDALRGVRALSQSTKALDDIYTRLSSGLRINRAGDDPAGLSVSETLRSDRRVYGQAIRNVGDMISLLSVQDSALEALSQIVTRQLELSTQAINGSYSFEQRKAMHTEANALTKEYNRIVESTKFNGIKVLEDPDQQLSIQIGKSSVQFNLAQDLSRPIGILEYNTGVTYPVTSGGPIEMTNGDMNNDGITDIIAINWGGNNISVHIANGDGTFKAPIERNAGASAYDVAVGD